MKAIMYTLILAASVLLINGCASGRVNLIENGQIFVEVVPGKESPASKIEVYQENGEVVISGWVESRPQGGHVHIELISPDGTVLSNKTASYKPHTHSWSGLKPLPRYTDRQAYFEKRIETVPPKGSKVRLDFN